MTTSSIAQYLDQKRVVRPIDWSAARREGGKLHAPAAAQSPAKASNGSARISPPDTSNADAPTSYSGDPVDARINDSPSGRRGLGVFRPREAPPPPPDIDAQLAEAYHRGVQEGLDAARNEAATQRAMERAELQKRAVIERLDFQVNEYAKLAEVIAQGLAEVERRIAAVTTRILQPYLAEALSRQVIDDLAARIAKLTTSGHPALMKITGPAALLTKLKSQLEPLAIEVEYQTSGGVEITVEAQHTSIQSELAPWGKLLASLGEVR
jgi:hypothetical protein